LRRSAFLEEIRRLDPERDHQRIVFLCSCHEFAFDMVRSLEFALFRTFSVPSISGLLDRTGEFAQRAQKRYDDTDLIVSAMMAWGYDSDLGRAALRQMNQIHGRFGIANDDFLYVLSTFVYEPIRWIDEYGWRRMCEQERLAMFYFWREVGRRMNIKDLPADTESFERFNIAYEREHFRFVETNARVGAATRDMFLSWYPSWLRPLARPAIYALMDDPILVAFGFPHPSSLTRRLVEAALKARAVALRAFPPRHRPRIRTELRHRSYPSGYRIEELGPPSSGRPSPAVDGHTQPVGGAGSSA
jgi:hypothetical protein